MLTPLVCALLVCGERSERRRERKRRKKDEREVYRTRGATLRFAPLLCTAPHARCSLRRGIMHLAARRVPFRVTPLSRALVLLLLLLFFLLPPPPPPPPCGTLLIVAKKVSSAKCAAQPARVAHGRHTCVRTYKRTARPFRPPLFLRDKFRIVARGMRRKIINDRRQQLVTIPQIRKSRKLINYFPSLGI